MREYAILTTAADVAAAVKSLSTIHQAVSAVTCNLTTPPRPFIVVSPHPNRNFIAMALNFFIHSTPSRSGLVVIKLKEEKREMESIMRYNIVAMLSHWRLEIMKTPQGGKALQSAVYIVCYENVMENPKGFSQVPFWCKTYKSSLTSEFLDPLGKGKNLVDY